MIIASDLEGTLTSGVTVLGTGRYLRQNGASLRYLGFFTARLPAAIYYRTGIADPQPFKSQWMIDLLKFFAGYSLEEFRAVADYVIDHELWSNRREDVIAELEAHHRDGHRVIITSGVYVPFAEAFCDRLGFGEPLGTPIEVIQGNLTGRTTGPVNVGSVKLASLTEALQGEALLAAYGDTISDVPMLKLSAEPAAAYPDARLRAFALERGWRIIET